MLQKDIVVARFFEMHPGMSAAKFQKRLTELLKDRQNGIFLTIERDDALIDGKEKYPLADTLGFIAQFEAVIAVSASYGENGCEATCLLNTAMMLGNYQVVGTIFTDELEGATYLNTVRPAVVEVGYRPASDIPTIARELDGMGPADISKLPYAHLLLDFDPDCSGSLRSLLENTRKARIQLWLRLTEDQLSEYGNALMQEGILLVTYKKKAHSV